MNQGRMKRTRGEMGPFFDVETQNSKRVCRTPTQHVMPTTTEQPFERLCFETNSIREEHQFVKTEIVHMKAELRCVREEFTNYVLMFAKEMKEMKEMIVLIARECRSTNINRSHHSHIQSH
jgi:hypothetical protein